jgi:hypothetical protein
MRRTVVITVLFTVLGAMASSAVSRVIAQRHRLQNAVMWLMASHLQQLETGLRTQSCGNAAADLASLRHMQSELLRAFPLSTADEYEFRARANALATAVAADPGTDCPVLARQLKRVRGACDDCHREFR